MAHHSIQLRIGSVPRTPAFPNDDDGVGGALWSSFARAMTDGITPPVAFLFQREQVHRIDLAPLLADPRRGHWLISGLAGMEGVEALAMVGVLYRRRGPAVQGRYGVVFVEWPDGRWWLAYRAIGDDGQFMRGSDRVIERAVDDLPRPGGLGGWFRRARFEEIRADLRLPGSELVN